MINIPYIFKLDVNDSLEVKMCILISYFLLHSRYVMLIFRGQQLLISAYN